MVLNCIFFFFFRIEENRQILRLFNIAKKQKKLNNKEKINEESFLPQEHFFIAKCFTSVLLQHHFQLPKRFTIVSQFEHHP